MNARTLLTGVVLCWLGQAKPIRCVAQDAVEPITTKSKYGVVEEFSVLSSNKALRQGTYVRYHPAGPIAGVSIYEAGNYEHGMKEGLWRTFTEHYPWNKLTSKGTYHAGMPEGLWLYYHAPRTGNSPSKKMTPNGKEPKAGYSVDLDDSTGIVQAKGTFRRGDRVGLWTYYDYTGKVVQKINHSTGQLMFWQPGTGEPRSGEAAAANHPVLYVGGKEQLQLNILANLDQTGLLQAGKTGVADFVVEVDSVGRQVSLRLASNAAPTKYEALLLPGLNRLPPMWLPQVSNGQAMAGQYRIRITTTEEKIQGHSGNRVRIEPLGD